MKLFTILVLYVVTSDSFVNGHLRSRQGTQDSRARARGLNERRQNERNLIGKDLRSDVTELFTKKRSSVPVSGIFRSGGFGGSIDDTIAMKIQSSLPLDEFPDEN